jgi:hypothetical protein
MAEKKLTKEELETAGLNCIEIDWDNRQKLTALFHHYSEQNEALPASGVNERGDLTPNLSLLARLGKIVQGKQVFKTLYAREMLDAAIKKSGIENLDYKSESDETALVREKLQDAVDIAHRNGSNTDKKLQEALSKVRMLSTENKKLTETVANLKQKLAAKEGQLSTSNNRVYALAEHEQVTLKRTF